MSPAERDKPLRVCLEAFASTGTESGNDMSLAGLASGLCRLVDGNEEYIFFAGAEPNPLLQEFMTGPCREFVLPRRTELPLKWKQAAKQLPGAAAVWRKVRCQVRKHRRKDWLLDSAGQLESTGADIVHFPRQAAYVTELPSIYQPHDLQHLHYPEFFSKEEYECREVRYRAFCQRAKLVVAMTSWGRQDLLRNYGLAEDKVAVVPHAPLLTPTPTQNELQAAREKLRLPEAFIFYPAQTWRHKNHVGLLRALATLRERDGIRVPLVCSGHRNNGFPQIESEIARLLLGEQVQFVGYVAPVELHCLYRLCRCMVFPSKFEGWGLPLLEAGAAGAPVVCSGVRPISDVVADAALLFDPDRPSDIADALRRVWTDAVLRGELSRRGRQRALLFSWEKTARIYRAHYRKVAGRELREEDHELLSEPPLV
ncbi:MAG: glycosyltransferase family 4 protein [Acidobacteriia bacterium]|nr:glycosyltransferase family 4 protein [Terriglobia bacterium]